MCSEAPDMSGANAAALKSAELSQEQFDWVKQTYDKEAPLREAASKRAQDVSDAQIKSMQLQDSLAQEGAQRYRSTFQPIEDKIAAEAQSYDTPARRAAEAGQAVADVGTQADLARDTATREAEARGVDPSSGAYAATLARNAIQTAAAKAAAGNAAVKNVETIGSAKMMDAAGLGRGVVSSQGTNASLALNAGTSAAMTGRAALDNATSGTAMMQGGYSGAINGLQGASSAMAGVGKVQAGVDASNSAGTGAAVGTIGMIAVAI